MIIAKKIINHLKYKFKNKNNIYINPKKDHNDLTILIICDL